MTKLTGHGQKGVIMDKAMPTAPIDMDHLIETIEELRHQAHKAPFSDLVARDFVCGIADWCCALASHLRDQEIANIRTANVASCLANGINPD
jgi:tryptophanyl-tRNA synthetase